jgi:hypothetical protein
MQNKMGLNLINEHHVITGNKAGDDTLYYYIETHGTRQFQNTWNIHMDVSNKIEQAYIRSLEVADKDGIDPSSIQIRKVITCIGEKLDYDEFMKETRIHYALSKLNTREIMDLNLEKIACQYKLNQQEDEPHKMSSLKIVSEDTNKVEPTMNEILSSIRRILSEDK